MKFAVFVILSCVCVLSYGAQKDTIWGNVVHNVHQIGIETVQKSSTIWTVKKHTLVFPKVPTQTVIAGIRHIDYKSHPSQVTFVKGGVGHYDVTFEITSQRSHGINSTFIFYAVN